MPLSTKIVLHSPVGDPARLEAFVERCLADGVRLIAVVGEGAPAVEDLIDEIIVGDGTDRSRFILTTSHAGMSVADVLDLVSRWDIGGAADVEQVQL
ncbi:flagellar biosynthesis/type III secretory pathway ATPase [Inquilinus ginsengisoli]|uniref:Flagellar biosynthesis/type III secretory pathway ATPase n=1 Tax=Inquilinus ginsengisoli TaxID=363840 RepID=A0ABU1JYH0_9PROT|nr:hypothetical protein [Inquilinus ginsengisoli]MDR6293666.1 flagellar biosynthesis/type III secretory pathway ATPase [Inquilinus ginsengisoli]